MKVRTECLEYRYIREILAKKGSIKKGMSDRKQLAYNIFFNLLCSGINVLFPFLIVSYASHILAVDKIGAVDYGVSIVNWFVKFAVFGTDFYGIREVAKWNNGKNNEKKNEVFLEIFLLNICMGVFCAFIYILTFHFLNVDVGLKWIMLIYICFNPFVTDWFFQGIEQYRQIAIKNFISRSICLITLVLLVKKEDDYIAYAFVGALYVLVNSIVNFYQLKKLVKVNLKKIKAKAIIWHGRNCCPLFASSFFSTLQGNIDVVIAGWLLGNMYSAYAHRCSLIITAGVLVATAIINVTTPRIVRLNQNNQEDVGESIDKLKVVILFIMIPVFCIYIVCSSSILYIVGGSQYIAAQSLLRCYAPAVIFIPLNTLLHQNVINIIGKEKAGTWIIFLSCLIYVALSVFLCRAFGIFGIGLAKSISEAVSFIIKGIYLSRKSRIVIKFKFVMKYMIAGSVMIGVLILIGGLKNNILWLPVQCAVGGLVYIIILLKLKECTLMDMKKSWEDRKYIHKKYGKNSA